MAQVETVQFFQFDSEGNMYMFPPGGGCTGIPKLVLPGDEMIFSGETVGYGQKSETSSSSVLDSQNLQSDSSSSVSKRSFNAPLKTEDLNELKHKNFSEDTLKKVKWAVKMYREWRANRLIQGELVPLDLDDKNTVTSEGLNSAMPRFITEVQKLNGEPFPGRTLYDIIICVQFHLEICGFCFKLLSDDTFKDIKWTLDNIMKIRTSEGVGVSVRKAQILSVSDEEYLWSLGLLGSNTPDVLLNTVVFMIGKGFALRAGKEHQYS